MIEALSALAAVVLLWLRFRQARSLRRILASLDDKQREELRKALEKEGESGRKAD